MISLREIMKMMWLTKESFAAAGGEILLHNPSKKYSAAEGGKILFAQPHIVIWREAPKKDYFQNPEIMGFQACRLRLISGSC
jgi:hypothetical protein